MSSSSRSSNSRKSGSTRKSSGKAATSRGKRPAAARASSKSRGKKKTKKGHKKPGVLWRILRTGLVLTFLLGLLGAGAVAAVFWHWSQDLPEVFSVSDYRPKEVSRIYDRNGNVLLELYEEKRTVVPFDEIPQTMRYAMIAAEDSNFYEHKGLDYVGVMRAAWTNVREGGFSQGASTITQQVVKNLLLTPEKELKRKVQEVLLARRLEEVLSKDEILWIYLNQVYFGHRTYGVEEASRHYFNKHARALDLNEAATLAGLVQSPERLSPIKHPERATERRNYVLERMYSEGFITEDVYRETLDKPITVRRVDAPTMGEARHFVESVRRDLIEEYGEGYLYTAGLEIYTTVDLDIQAEADRALQKGLRDFDARHGLYRPVKKPRKEPEIGKLVADEVYRAEVVEVNEDEDRVEVRVGPFRAPLDLAPRSRVIAEDKKLSEVFEVGQYWEVVHGAGPFSEPKSFKLKPGPEGAVVCIDPHTRQVVAVAGGYSYEESTFNRGLQALRQTGSSFKPFVYSAALEARVITPATVIDDAPKVFHIKGQREPYKPENYDGKFHGPMTARVALAKSRNTIAVDVMERLGLERTIEFSNRIGIERELQPIWSLALGSTELTALESANAYATWAAGGVLAEPIFVSRIQTHDGNVIYEGVAEPRRVISEEVAWLTTNMLRSVATDGTGKKHLANWDHISVGKTGTTNGPKDAWFIGYTTYYVTAVYVGYDDPRKMGGREGGSTTALPIWADFMKSIHKGLAVRDFTRPPGIIEAQVSARSGRLSGRDSAITEYFLPGTVPTRRDRDDEDELDEADWAMRELGEYPADGEVQRFDDGEGGVIEYRIERDEGDPVDVIDTREAPREVPPGPPRRQVDERGQDDDDQGSSIRGVGVEEETDDIREVSNPRDDDRDAGETGTTRRERKREAVERVEVPEPERKPEPEPEADDTADDDDDDDEATERKSRRKPRRRVKTRSRDLGDQVIIN